MLSISSLLLIPLLPLACFVLLSLLGKRISAGIGGMIGTSSIFVSCVLSLITAYQYFFVSGQLNATYQKIIAAKYVWLQITAGYSIDMGMILDPISVMMLVVVSFISLMVHFYSLGYMKGEERFNTYYAFLSLFTFSMLGLVVATNIFQMYIFWELVGISSYLLIGFYFTKPSAVAAAKKAFIVTRFADAGFLIGILILSYYAESLDFETIIQRFTTNTDYLQGAISASFLSISAISWGLVLVFMGGAGKSAMFPLHIWLPDAMEGPTPVSALIHAATMVVAGVYLLARLFPVYAMCSPVALDVITYTALFSSLFAALIACTQTDIKRVLAYSTMSQIGFMMFSLGISGAWGQNSLGYTASMFHLFTHAMFKALLFLCAGAIIHAIHSNDLKEMGGLRKIMPLTNLAFLCGCLAIAGIPPFAGFFSKEEILTACLKANTFVFVIALLTACLTAFYMFRLYYRIFWNRVYVSNGHDTGHKHSQSLFISIPLIILSICSIFAGFIPFHKLVTITGYILPTEFHPGFAAITVAFSISGALVARILYKEEAGKSAHFKRWLDRLYTSALNKFYIDEIYMFITKNIIFKYMGKPSAWFDTTIINGMMNQLALRTSGVYDRIKFIQSGSLRQYVAYFFAAIVGFAIFLIYILK
jgi:NADH-quinone oxidoreductase subunit L